MGWWKKIGASKTGDIIGGKRKIGLFQKDFWGKLKGKKNFLLKALG